MRVIVVIHLSKCLSLVVLCFQELHFYSNYKVVMRSVYKQLRIVKVFLGLCFFLKVMIFEWLIFLDFFPKCTKLIVTVSLRYKILSPLCAIYLAGNLAKSSGGPLN